MATTNNPRNARIRLGLDLAGVLTIVGVILLTLRLLGFEPIGWGGAITLFVIINLCRAAVRSVTTRIMSHVTTDAVRQPSTGVEGIGADAQAIGWSVAMGLVPGYGHDNGGDTLDQYRDTLMREWAHVMNETLASHGFLISAVMTPGKVIYPETSGCPKGGEDVMLISGSSNPTKVGPERFGEYVEAVRYVVMVVGELMGQNSVRIEFTGIARSIYHRVDGRY